MMRNGYSSAGKRFTGIRPVSQEVDAKAKKYSAENGVSYVQAVKIVLGNDDELAQRYFSEDPVIDEKD